MYTQNILDSVKMPDLREAAHYLNQYSANINLRRISKERLVEKLRLRGGELLQNRKEGFPDQKVMRTLKAINTKMPKPKMEADPKSARKKRTSTSDVVNQYISSSDSENPRTCFGKEFDMTSRKCQEGCTAFTNCMITFEHFQNHMDNQMIEGRKAYDELMTKLPELEKQRKLIVKNIRNLETKIKRVEATEERKKKRGKLLA